MSPGAGAWPEPPADWASTRDALHLWTQMVGKTRLALSPRENHWWHVTLYVTSRGLWTSPIPYPGKTFEVEFDFVDQRLVARPSDGPARHMPLESQSVADFYGRYLELLASIGVQIRMRPIPSEIPNPVPFPEDRMRREYDPGAASRWWQMVLQADRVLKRFRGNFRGKCSPSHFWWGSFDLSSTRFSGRPAPRHPGGVPNLPDWVTAEAYSHECISAGWWPGNAGGPVQEPAFYAYAYPEPAGCPEARVLPAAAAYHPVLHEWILPYSDVRNSPDPDSTLLEFLQSTYDAASGLAGWDRPRLEA